MTPRKSYAAATKDSVSIKQPSLLTSINELTAVSAKKRKGPYAKVSEKGNKLSLRLDDDDELEDGGEKFARTVERLIKEDEKDRIYEEANLKESQSGVDDESENDLIDVDEDESIVEDESRAQRGTLFRSLIDEECNKIESSTSMEGVRQYRTLGDIMFEQLEEKRRKEAEKEKMELFTETTRTAYTNLGKYMSRFRSGKLPQLLKCIPKLKNWIDILWLTRPENWSCHAIKEATPIFVNGLRSRDVSRYLQYVVLPAVEKSIDTHSKLNIHLFEALKRAIFKSQEWIKGIYFPIILDEQCNYKKAAIINSVLAKCSITALTAGALLVKLATLPSHNNVIIYSMLRILNKKHNLPLNVLSAMVNFFAQYLDGEKANESPTVIWQQLLLVFVQRWKGDLNDEQKEILRAVIKRHPHEKISPEIRRELLAYNLQTNKR